jgi:hypothetical protein
LGEFVAETLPSKSTLQESWFSGLRGSLYVMRVPIVMAGVTVAALALSEQAQEIYRVLAQDRPGTPGFQFHWVLALLALFALSLVFWQVARGLSYDYSVRELGPPHPLARVVLRWLPRFLATTPLFGAALGLWLCHSEELVNRDPLLNDLVQGVDRLRRDFEMGIGVCIALGVVVFIITLIFERRMQEAGRTRQVATYSNWVVFPIVAAASVALLALDPVSLPQAVGVVPIFALWMAALALLVGLLARLSILAIPVLGLLIIYVAGVEVFKLADNHEFRHETRPVERRAVDEAFDSWLASRKDRSAYEAAKKPYPVYIVAAEGGGLYAAYLTAQFLARMQDLCPGFAQHVFTVSSVSGGSLGAAVFGGLMANEPDAAQPAPCKRGDTGVGPMEERAKRILSSDFLAPAVWGALFPDFLQRFIPHPMPFLDRARLLEHAFERAWTGDGENPMTRGLFDLCGNDMAGCLTGATPHLAFNVTNIETGLQLVLSPLDLTPVGQNADPLVRLPGKIYDFFGVTGADAFHIQLSTAVGLSARFPWLSPPGWFAREPELPPEQMARRARRIERTMRVKSAKTRYTFVDGGYVDNSGVATALNIATYLDTRQPRANVDLRVIMISALWAPLDRLQIDPPLDRNRGEIFPPIDAAINSRQGRGFKTQFDAAFEAKPGLNITETGFYYGYLELPLGWQLSDVSRNYISLFRGDPERCLANGKDKDSLANYVRKSGENHETTAVSYIKRADCVTALLRNELTPAEPRLDMPDINPLN